MQQTSTRKQMIWQDLSCCMVHGLHFVLIPFAAGCAGLARQLICKLRVAYVITLLCDLLHLQCFDTTASSEARAGAHEPLHMDPKELPRWSKALTQYRCAEYAGSAVTAHASTARCRHAMAGRSKAVVVLQQLCMLCWHSQISTDCTIRAWAMHAVLACTIPLQVQSLSDCMCDSCTHRVCCLRRAQ
jgi:hypothetical protein